MKVAVVYDCFPHYRAGILQELLQSPEHEYLLVAGEKSTNPSIKEWPIENRDRFSAARCKKIFSSFIYQNGLIKLALRRDLGAVVFLGNPYFLSTWISALAARLTGKRVLFWTHGWTREESGLKTLIRSIFYKLAHGLMLYGHFAKMAGLMKGFSADQLYVIYNSLDYEKQREVREHLPNESALTVKEELFEQPYWPMIICSARLTSECRFDLLLNAQAKLRDQGYPVNVLLVGEGPKKSFLQMKAARLNLPVKFFGACYDEKVLARLIRAAHATVSPGKVGLTAMQSLAYGTPVITHDDPQAQMPESEAILPGRTGDFFRRDDVDDLARIIQVWISKEIRDARTQADCYEIIEKFYNPAFQCRAINRAVSGAPADDLFWLRERPASVSSPVRHFSHLCPCETSAVAAPTAA